MYLLPPLENRFLERPGVFAGKAKHVIPNLTYDEFWEDLYARLSQVPGLQFPIKKGNKHIDPHFGHFGFRWHPVTHTPQYFHIGIDIPNKVGTLAYALLPGIFEYSGFTETNGKYVLLSHPEIKTDDGFYLYSMYMHLSKYAVRFTRYEKMLREISFHTYPKIPITTTRAIGRVGATGNLRGMITHLHVQIELRRKDTIVALDGARVFGIASKQNTTADLKTNEEFDQFSKLHKSSLEDWQDVWKA